MKRDSGKGDLRMHQKKKIMKVVLMICFFLIGGLWYMFFYRTDTGTKEDEMPDRVLLVPSSVSVTGEPLTPVVTQEAESKQKLSPLPSPTMVPRVIYVYVCGAVNAPGVYDLIEGARLHMAVELAGGFAEQADTAYHNLAREVSDGERIYILTEEETKELSVLERIGGEPESTLTGRPSDAGVSGDSGNHAAQTVTGPVNINTATVAELTALPGIGEAKAESIIEYRESVGRFTAIEEIMNISGIGEAMFDRIKDKITVK